MTSIGIVAKGEREAIVEALAKIKEIQGLKIIFIKQSDFERLYVVTERIFDVKQELEK